MSTQIPDHNSFLKPNSLSFICVYFFFSNNLFRFYYFLLFFLFFFIIIIWISSRFRIWRGYVCNFRLFFTVIYKGGTLYISSLALVCVTVRPRSLYPMHCCVYCTTLYTVIHYTVFVLDFCCFFYRSLSLSCLFVFPNSQIEDFFGYFYYLPPTRRTTLSPHQ